VLYKTVLNTIPSIQYLSAKAYTDSPIRMYMTGHIHNNLWVSSPILLSSHCMSFLQGVVSVCLWAKIVRALLLSCRESVY